MSFAKRTKFRAAGEDLSPPIPLLHPRLVGALAGVVGAGLGAAAADFHLAPAAAVVLGEVEEEPAAVPAAALLDAGQLRRRQQIRGRACDRPEHAVEGGPALVPDPFEAGLAWCYQRMAERAGESLVEDGEIAGIGLAAVGEGGEAAV